MAPFRIDDRYGPVSDTGESSGLPLMSEEQYWQDNEIIRNDVHSAIVICYTHRAINHIPAGDTDVFRPDEQPIPEYRPDSIPRCKA